MNHASLQSLLDPETSIRAATDVVDVVSGCQVMAATARAWVELIPDTDLLRQYGKAVNDLDDTQLAELGEVHHELTDETGGGCAAALQVRFCDMTVEDQREALLVAATMRAETVYLTSEDSAAVFDTVLGALPHARLVELAGEISGIYAADQQSGRPYANN